MKVAIPTFGTKISPRFDCARVIVLISFKDGEIVNRTEVPIDDAPPRLRIHFLVDRGVKLVLCGGIRRCDYFALGDANIKVHPGLTGEVEEIIQFFLDDALPESPTWERCTFGGGAFGGRGGHRYGGSPSLSFDEAGKEPPFGGKGKGGRKNATRKR